MKVLETSYKAIEKLSYYLVWVGMIALLLMIAFVSYDILARFLFSRPVAGSTELVSMLMAVVSFFCLPLTQFQKRNITVTFIVDMLRPKAGAFITGLTALICALFTVIFTWQTYEQGLGDHGANAVSTVMAIPQAPFKLAAAFASLVLFLAFAIDFMRACLFHDEKT